MDLSAAFLENHRWLWAVVYARLGDHGATDDVLQEVSLAAVREKDVAEIRQVRAWLYQVAVRQVLLFQRRESRYRQRIEHYCHTAKSIEFSSSAELLSLGEQQELVRTALHCVKPSDRQVLLLKYCQGLSCQEIAELLGVRETTIQSRLLRARRRLRTQLLQNEDFKEFRHVQS